MIFFPSIISKDNLDFAIHQGLTKDLSLTSLKKSLKGTYQKQKKQKKGGGGGGGANA